VKFGVIWHVMWHVICNSIIWYAIYHHIAWWLYNMLYVIMTYNMSYNMSYNITHTKFDIHRVLQWFFFDFMMDLLSLFSELEAYSWKYLAKFSWNQTKTTHKTTTLKQDYNKITTRLKQYRNKTKARLRD
jgi:hypothetical protein